MLSSGLQRELRCLLCVGQSLSAALYEDAVAHQVSCCSSSSHSAPTLTNNICSSLTQNLAFQHLGPVIVQSSPFLWD